MEMLSFIEAKTSACCAICSDYLGTLMYYT